MLSKIFLVFLLAMAVLAMFGRLRFPKGGRRAGRAAVKSEVALKCAHCGTYIVGNGPCPCGAVPVKEG